MKRHRWVAAVAIELTEEQMNEAERAERGGEGHMELGALSSEADVIVSWSIGCYTCEMAFRPAIRESSCPGEPTGYDATGEPIYG